MVIVQFAMFVYWMAIQGRIWWWMMHDAWCMMNDEWWMNEPFQKAKWRRNWSTIHFDPDGRDLWLYFTTVASYIPTYEGCNPMVMPHNMNHHYKILYIYIYIHIPYIHTLTYIHIYILHIYIYIYIYHINLFVTLTFYLFISRISPPWHFCRAWSPHWARSASRHPAALWKTVKRRGMCHVWCVFNTYIYIS